MRCRLLLQDPPHANNPEHQCCPETHLSAIIHFRLLTELYEVSKCLWEILNPLPEVFQNYKPPFPCPASTRRNRGKQNVSCCRQTGFVYSMYFGFGFLHKIQQSFHVNAYRFGGNNLWWQPEAGQLWIWGAERKMFPLIEIHTDSCIEKHYRDTRGHWIQQRCFLGSGSFH